MLFIVSHRLPFLCENMKVGVFYWFVCFVCFFFHGGNREQNSTPDINSFDPSKADLEKNDHKFSWEN